MPEANEFHLHLEYDQDYDETWTWYIDTDESAAKTLVGWSATLEIRSGDRTTTALLTLTSTPASGITLGGAAGTIRVVITEAQIIALSADSGRWHLVMTDGDSDNHVIVKGPWTRHKD